MHAQFTWVLHVYMKIGRASNSVYIQKGIYSVIWGMSRCSSLTRAGQEEHQPWALTWEGVLV